MKSSLVYFFLLAAVLHAVAEATEVNRERESDPARAEKPKSNYRTLSYLPFRLFKVFMFLLAAVKHAVAAPWRPFSISIPSRTQTYTPPSYNPRPSSSDNQPPLGVPSVTSTGTGLDMAELRLPTSMVEGLTDEQKQKLILEALEKSGHKMPAGTQTHNYYNQDDIQTNGRFDLDKAMRQELGMLDVNLPKAAVEQAKNVKASTVAVDEPEPTYMPGQDDNKKFDLPYMEKGG